MRDFPARRLVCLTEETVETLYLLGEEDRIVGLAVTTAHPALAIASANAGPVGVVLALNDAVHRRGASYLSFEKPPSHLSVTARHARKRASASAGALIILSFESGLVRLESWTQLDSNLSLCDIVLYYSQ
jgi:hypothetical protein